MSLADAIAAAAKRPGGLCTIGQIRETLSDEDAVALDAALVNRKVSVGAIITGLAAVGIASSRSPVERHRRGECLCGAR